MESRLSPNRAWRRMAIALAGWAIVSAGTVGAQCTVDVQGTDDHVKQSDLSQFCLGGVCGGTGTTVGWSWDNTTWPGGNTGDACALFDTNNDGSVNRAICVTVSGSAVMQAGNPKCYTCTDAAPDRCTGGTLVACSGGTTCSVTVAANDPFALDANHVGNICDDTAGCPGSAACCRVKDTQASCCVAPADTGSGVLIDACSYPSQVPNSNSVDCIVTRACNNAADCDDHNACTVDSCDGTFGVCRHVAGNAGAQCRASAGPCDVAESCTGTSINCPADGFATGSVCRAASDLCDVAETCNGTSANCPADGAKASGVVCRSSTGTCDVAEVCDGVSTTCPADGSSGSNVSCNDGSACTTGDHCDGAGHCVGGSAPNCNDGNPCTDDGCNPATGCTHVNNNDPCSDGSACTANDACSGGACVGGAVDNCDDGNPCTTDTCNPATGCVHTNNTNPCDDGSACTTNDVCGGGTCHGGPAPNCNDNDVCTTDTCSPATGCVHTQNTASCDDGNACTVNDKCAAGVCGGTTRNCDDTNGCTDDSCNPDTGCMHVNNNDPCNDGDACTTEDACSGGSCHGGPALDCNDGNVCTNDGCNAGSGCTHSNNSAPCSDANQCTTNDTCSGGSCQSGAAPDCDDGNACTIDSCVAPGGCDHQPVGTPCCNVDADCNDTDACTQNNRCVAHSCTSDPVDCDDSNPCTDDGCNPDTGCMHVNNNAACDDGSACTTEDTCGGGTCHGGPAPDCNDANVCTTDTCNPATGCVNTNNTAPCDDGSLCTTNDTCAGGACIGGPAPDCDDGDVCTTEGCNPLTGCTHSFNTAPCDDHNACSVGDACLNGTCVGMPRNCGDGNGCTDDACNPMTGCTHTNNSDPCNDGNACTADDTCVAGSCEGGFINCNDGNVCTSDSCNPATGCVNAPNTLPCDDANACTTNDVCGGGTCHGGPAPACADNNPCTDDACDPDSGCTHNANSAPCDDGNPCTENDVCAGKICAAGPAINCNDLNGCTDDTCNPDTGQCEHVDNAAPCDDGNVCTLNDHCAAGSCMGGFLDTCDDRLNCTTDTCNPLTGCHHAPVDEPCCDLDSECIDSLGCTTNERCVNNQCVSDPVVCDDGRPCTIDTCHDEQGGFICVSTPCYPDHTDQCPDVIPSCIPPECGNGVVRGDLGETCDPPGSTPPGHPGAVCRDDCTFCGDMVVDADHHEDCDDGNTIQGCVKNDSFPADTGPNPCRNDCTKEICRDPTKAALSAMMDKFTFHGRLSSTSDVDFSSGHFTIELTTTSGRVLYRASIPAGQIVSIRPGGAGPYKFTSKLAKATGGIAKMKVRRQGDAYRATVQGFGNLLGVQEDMLTKVHSGGSNWTVLGAWEQRSLSLWKFHPTEAH